MALVEAHTAEGQVIAIANSGSDGSYAISLPPGSYTLAAVTSGPFPRCPQAAAVVPPHAVAVVDIDCDTGIR